MYGIATGVVTIVLALIAHIAKQDTNNVVGWLLYLPILIGLILNAIAFSKANGGYVTYKNIYGSCFKQVMIMTIIMVAWTIIYIYAFPEMKEQYIERAHEEMLKQQGMTDDKVDMAMNLTKKMYTTIMISGSLFGNLILGALLSLIAAAIPPKKGERPMADNF